MTWICALRIYFPLRKIECWLPKESPLYTRLRWVYGVEAPKCNLHSVSPLCEGCPCFNHPPHFFPREFDLFPFVFCQPWRNVVLPPVRFELVDVLVVDEYASLFCVDRAISQWFLYFPISGRSPPLNGPWERPSTHLCSFEVCVLMGSQRSSFPGTSTESSHEWVLRYIVFFRSMIYGRWLQPANVLHL